MNPAQGAQLADAGGTQVMLQGGMHPDYGMEKIEAMIGAVRAAFPSMHLHSLSPSEIAHLSKQSGLSIDAVLERLKKAGLDSVPGASDLLVDRMRALVSPRKITVEQWREVMRALARSGMFSSATMTYGMGETVEERIEHLDVVRSIQDETGIIRAFIPWSFSPTGTDMAHIAPAGGIDYLKTVAMARVYLDNVPCIQAGWLTEGMALAQIALTFGASDMGGVLTEEVVVRATGVETRTTVDEMIRVIRAAGRIPVQRDSRYREIRRFS
jgi:cyclic dehypoxanthinyl futalosine synthase